MDAISKLGLVTLNVDAIRIATKTASIDLRPDAKPKFMKPRKLPYALEAPVQRELKRLQDDGIIESIESNYWATPIVVVHKPDGRVRICGDYQMTLNPFIASSVTAGLDVEDSLAKLSGNKFFSKIDVKDAYLQVPLDASSQVLTVISTPFGLYKYRCLPFGVKSAPHIFKTRIRKTLHGLETVFCHLDDILIAAKSKEEHDRLLAEVKKTLHEAGLPINENKTTYNQTEVFHLGYKIRANEILRDGRKVAMFRKKSATRAC